MKEIEKKPGEYLVSRGQITARRSCTGCGAVIAWIETEAGRRMPLSLATTREVPCPELPDHRGRRCARCESTGTLYLVLNHWADCPERARFSRPSSSRPSSRASTPPPSSD